MKKPVFLFLMFFAAMATFAQSYCLIPANTTPDAYSKAQYHQEISATVAGTKTVLHTQNSEGTYSNYALLPTVVDVPQGGQITLAWKDNKQGTNSCAYQRLFLYFDADANKDFTGTGERLTVLGNAAADNNTACANGSYTITVPATLPVGTITRIRLYFQGSYESNEGPCNQSKRKCSDVQIRVVDKPTGWTSVTVGTSDINLGTAVFQGTSATSSIQPKTQSVTVVATPKSNNRFVNWVDSRNAEVSTNATYTFVASTDMALTAVFDKPGYQPSTGTISTGASGYLTGISSLGGSDNVGYAATQKPATLSSLLGQTLRVERGAQVTIKLTGDAGKYLKNCHKYLYIDWNGNRSYNVRNELVSSKQRNSASDADSDWTVTFTVPNYYAQAVGRVKIVFTNPTTATFDACKNPSVVIEKGIVYEFPIEIKQPLSANPMRDLVRRIDPAAADKFVFEQIESDKDIFEIDQKEGKIVIRGNNYSTMGAGLNWYLKYYCGVHLSWNGMKATLPASLPAVAVKERRESATDLRYYLNYCTFSYSMSFWGWERWEQEIDWMILHGINLPLAITGAEMVWYKLLAEYGYTNTEINNFVSGPAFLAWWHMNNLEAWGGPNPASWYTQQVELQQNIVARYRDFGIEPCFAGYAGMVPSNAAEKLGLSVTNPGNWQSFKRPFFLKPTDPRFNELADKYYQITEELFGTAKYFGIDPFHEGGSVAGVDLNAAGLAIMGAVKRANPDGIWVVQAWQDNPREAVVGNIPAGDLIVLDLFSESYPMWGDTPSPWYRAQGYKQHEWVYNMLLNFGGRVGMFGKMNRVINSYYKAIAHENGKKLRGVGTSMEAIENNPVMYELLYELPWRPVKQTKEDFSTDYAKARYGTNNAALIDAWKKLANTSYNCSDASTQEGTTGSVFCGRPSLANDMVISCCDGRNIYYTPSEQIQALSKMVEVADDFKGNNNFEYDLVDVMRQSIADKAHQLRKEIITAFNSRNRTVYLEKRQLFLELLLAQDRVCGTRSEFMVGTWIEQAKKIAPDAIGKALNEWNARTMITVWGPRASANGGLADYSYREWNGVLKDFYYVRWKKFFDELDKVAGSSTSVPSINWFNLEEPWTRETTLYPSTPTENAVDVVKELYQKYFEIAPPTPVDKYCEPAGSLCADAGQGYPAKTETLGAAENLSYTLTSRPAKVYNFYQGQTIKVKRGSTFTFKVTADTAPGFNGQADYRYMKWTNRYLWVDWNGDKAFARSESVGAVQFDASSNDNAHFSQLVTVPTDAKLGLTRVRFKFLNGTGSPLETLNEPCTDAILGATYDYVIDIEDVDVGVNEAQQQETLNFYPNPANEYISLTPDVCRVVIYSANGQRTIESKEKGVDISSLKPSVYVVELSDGEKSTHRILIKK